MPLGTKGALLFLGRKGSRMNPLSPTLFRTSLPSSKEPLGLTLLVFAAGQLAAKVGRCTCNAHPPGRQKMSSKPEMAIPGAWNQNGPGGPECMSGSLEL